MSNIKLLNGDSYELLKDIHDKSIDLVIIDPPYEYTTGGEAGCFGNKHRSYHEEYYKVAVNREEIVKKYLDKGFDRKKAQIWADKEVSRLDIKHISSGFDYSLLDILDNKMKHIYIYIWCSKWQLEPLLKHYIDKDCNYDVLTWHKTNPTPTMNNTYANDTEYLVMAREKGTTKLYGDYDSKKKYWITPSNKSDKDLYKHPTIKPLDIIKTLVSNSSVEGDVVLDCFMGSGTTGVACKELNRDFIGIELDKEYYDIAVKRINGITADGQISIFTDVDKIEQESLF